MEMDGPAASVLYNIPPWLPTITRPAWFKSSCFFLNSVIVEREGKRKIRPKLKMILAAAKQQVKIVQKFQ